MAKVAEGCELLAIAPLTINSDNTYSYEKPIMVPELEQITVTDTYAEASNYADNKQNIYKKKKTGADISITLTYLTKLLEAKLMGKKYNKGEVLSKNDDIQIAVAVLYKKIYSDGSYDLIVYYNVKLAKDDNSSTTSGESIEFAKVKLSGKVSPLPNGNIDYTIASDEVEASNTNLQNKIKNFFEEVQFYSEEENASNE